MQKLINPGKRSTYADIIIIIIIIIIIMNVQQHTVTQKEQHKIQCTKTYNNQHQTTIKCQSDSALKLNYNIIISYNKLSMYNK